MADMGQEFAELKRRVMALESDPHVIAAQSEARQIFADGLARVGEAVDAHKGEIAEALKSFATKPQVVELEKRVLGKVDEMLKAHRAQIAEALDSHLASVNDAVAATKPASPARGPAEPAANAMISEGAPSVGGVGDPGVQAPPPNKS